MIYKTLSIIIPVYNEEKTIIALLDKLESVDFNLEKEIVIVNDGSKDFSDRLIKSWINKRKRNFNVKYFIKENGGKGSAVKYGIENSTGDIVIIQDADLEYNPNEINACIQPIIDNKAKIVYGSRELTGEKRKYSYLSFFVGGIVVTQWINFLFGTGLTDEPTCYKTFDGKLIRELLFDGEGFEWEPEITCKLIKLGFKIYEVGITYSPRNLEEGKKINSIDGLKALWVILFWRFASIKKEKDKLQLFPDSYNLFRSNNLKTLLLIVFSIAVLVRLLIIIPGFDNPEVNYSRPDTQSYLKPAYTLSQTGKFNYNINTSKSYAYRTPGYPFYMALFYSFTNNLKFPIIMMCIISALTSIPIFYIGASFGGKWVGFVAGLLFALNVTSIAHAPLLLSDTLFTFFVAIQFWYFMKFYFTKRPLFLFMSVIIASIAVYIRAVGILWILPCMFLILIVNGMRIKRKIITSLVALVIFSLLLAPWMLRNYSNSLGFSMTTIGGDILFHNGAVLLGKVNRKSPEKIRHDMHEKLNSIFSKNPDIYKSELNRMNYKKNEMKKLILKYPFTYLSLCLRPWILLPDLPTFYQDLKITTSGKGTFDILNTHGIIAAVKYYFEGKMWLILISIPLLLVVAVSYIGCMLQFIKWIYQKQWFLIFTALAFIEYYLFLPGPITMPRYHLPALPMMCVMAGIFIVNLKKTEKKT